MSPALTDQPFDESNESQVQPVASTEVDDLCVHAPELITAHSPDHGSVMDVQSLCLPQDFGSMTGIEKVVTKVPFCKPDKSWFFRVDPDYTRCMAVLTENSEHYVVDPKLIPLLGGEAVVKLVVFAVNKQGVPFFWPLKVTAPRGLDEWSKSAQVAMNSAKTHWTKMKSNLETQCYEAFVAKGDLGEPAWPETDIQSLLSIALKDRVISTMDHPVIKRLNGEM